MEKRAVNLFANEVDPIDAAGRTIRAAFNLGASGVQVGTAFVASDESIAIPSYKRALQGAQETEAETE